ncbi:MSEP-CTERM sorting domain-containing protein [Bacteroidales bacterium OttesenSCG-928-M06]|nr:MSEP-CTERM sorting domain-containing protein [Bacteroidales bacterium OttesenSCG-928-M06]
MKSLLNPRWILLINTLPIMILFFLFLGEYNIIKSLLNEENVYLWKSFGCCLGILTLLNAVYAVYAILKKRKVSIFYACAALLTFIPFIYLYVNHASEIIPSDIPQWMTSENLLLYVGTFLMPTLAYAILVLVVHFTPESKNHAAWKSFLMSIAIPILWYVFFQVITPLWQPIDSNYSEHVFIIFIIISTLLFLLFLIRGFYIVATKKSNQWNKYQLYWKIPIGIIFPILGLLINNTLLFNHDIFMADEGFFGNFNNYWFYILAIINGILICLPNLKNKPYRIGLFIGRCILFCYTLYFFLVFLPFLPLSIFAITLIGAGFLMLAPLILFIIHINEISKDFNYLQKYLSKRFIILTSTVSFICIPTCITLSFLHDKNVLNEALSYVYTPNYSDSSHRINTSSLRKTLDNIKEHKQENNSIFMGKQIPYLSSYFNWVVLDNLTLSDKKIEQMEIIFFGNSSISLWEDNHLRNRDVDITDISVSSQYDESKEAWLSWVDLEITNNTTDVWSPEYATTFELPTGCWISDYYLYVGNRKEFGILAEKKAAAWVFSQIRNVNQDPGILHYLKDNKVAFRVFPFLDNEVRKTGIQFLHKDPVVITIDGYAIELGNREKILDTIIEVDQAIYVPANQKEKLNMVERDPYFHFIVDVSSGKNETVSEYITQIDSFYQSSGLISENTQISFVNTYTKTYYFKDSWRQEYKQPNYQSGFFLDRAMRTILFDSYKQNSTSYPIMIVLTDDIEKSILNDNFYDFKMTFPENDWFYVLKNGNTLESHSLATHSKYTVDNLAELSLNNPVLEYRTKDDAVYYLENNHEASIILKADKIQLDQNQLKERDWNSALAMQTHWLSQILHPETSDREWLASVKSSFATKIMTPVTSYIVVENEAQKAILKEKQEQVLSSNQSLDLGEEAQRMSEPGLILILILLGYLVYFRNKRPV